MKSSQFSADVAALEMLGWTVPATTTIHGAAEDSDAAEKVRDDDVLLSTISKAGVVHSMGSASVAFRLVKQTPTGSALVLRIIRDGEQVELEVKTIPSESHPQGSHLGIYLDVTPRFPLGVQVNLELVGGPPAGSVFSLMTIDKLTPGDLTEGHVVAATGTTPYDGEIGPISGTVQKMYGAKRNGSERFLVSTLNCDEVVGNVPEGLSVVAVTTLGEMREAVETIAAGQTGKPTDCENIAGAS